MRVHSECFTGEVLWSARCDCGPQLRRFLQQMDYEPEAVLLYHQGHEGYAVSNF